MKIEKRLSELESTIKTKNKIPMLLVDDNYNGTYTFNCVNYTKEQLDNFCIDRGVDVLIIDDTRRLL